MPGPTPKTAPLILDHVQPMEVACAGRLADMYVLSPYVWRVDGGYELLLRAVPHRDDNPALKIAEIWRGRSEDGRRFRMEDHPVLWPNPHGPDRDGCEDPTVVVHDGTTHVWYSGWHGAEDTGRLFHASGPTAGDLAKTGVVLDSTEDFSNPKEASIAPVNGGWRMLFEGARDGSSVIGSVRADTLDGPWSDPRSLLTPRPDAWDHNHVSTGPIVADPDGRFLMLYNGATDGPGWRIGWLRLSPDLLTVEERGDDWLVGPGEVDDGATDIAFAASAVTDDDGVTLYYTVSDKDLMMARLRWR